MNWQAFNPLNYLRKSGGQLRPMNDVLRELARESSTSSGVAVNPYTAWRCAAVFSCTKVLAEDVSSSPLHLFRKESDGGRQKADDLPLYYTLHDAPNPVMDSYQWLETNMYSMCMRGNAYNYVIRVNGWPREIWPIPPDNVRVKVQSDGIPTYEVKLDQGGWRLFPREEILHIRSISSNGIIGISPIEAAAESIGLSLATEKFGGKLFSNNARPGGIITVDQILTKEAKDDLKSSWQAAQGGLDNAHLTAVMPPGVKFQPISVPANEAQFLETRMFQLEDIAMIYRVPLVLLQRSGKTSSYASAEQFVLSYVTHTLRPWLVRIEKALRNQLIPEKYRKELYPEFSMQSLMRGTAEERARYYMVMIQNGLMSPNEGRALENMPPREGGDEFFMSSNMLTPANLAGSNPGKPEGPGGA